jgi:hypothetical protein
MKSATGWWCRCTPIYGYPPPRISDKVVTNLGRIADWYIEEHFSYIRVFGCSVPPHALPQFLPDRLVCREVAHQTVLGGISKELKASTEKGMAIFSPTYWYIFFTRFWPFESRGRGPGRNQAWSILNSRSTIHIRS